jgi:hypothetical protein
MNGMTVRTAVLLLGLSLSSAAAEAGGSRVGVVVAVPVGPMAPIAAPVFSVPGAPISSVPAAPVFATTRVAVPIHPVAPACCAVIVRPPLAPVFFPPFFPGFVPAAPQVVVTTTAPVTVNVAPPVAVVPAPVVVPHVPVMTPVSPLFFAPPVQTVVTPPAGGQIMIIRGSGF